MLLIIIFLSVFINVVVTNVLDQQQSIFRRTSMHVVNVLFHFFKVLIIEFINYLEVFTPERLL